jgi:hypothetical protein
MRIKLFLLIALFSVISNVSASKNKMERDSLEVTTYDFLILSTKYQNAFTFLGRDFGQDLSLQTVDVMYYFNSGLYLNGSVIKFFDTEISIQYSGTVGYIKEISKRFDVNMSYSQFFMSSDSKIAGVQNLGFLQGGVGLDWGLMYSTLSGQWLISDQTDFFLSSQHSRYFQFNQKLFQKIIVGFEPKATFIAGSRLFHLGALTDISTYSLDEFSAIKALSAEISIPFNFSLGAFEIEFSPKYVHPVNVPDFDFSKRRFVYSIDLSYILPVRRK